MTTIITLLLILGISSVTAQIEKEPTHLAYAIEKLNGNACDIQLRCMIDTPWHNYAEKQTKDFIGTGTKISFEKTPDLALIGMLIEKGKKVAYVKEVGILNYEYPGTWTSYKKLRSALV